ncbi:MAG TPA: VOC family protein [Ottowia sp.]|uniref:VOC family protein n=1 Tax=Ottowia sp. TaxID=1898956 RepID=UPI002C474133|nr:VOC family protein [Ottowia sp.]HMN21345.1 VOC family protein [Ottowia sp.]
MSEEAAVHAGLDHLVVLADTLEQGAAWCERVLGVPAGPGGRHAQFGTHNRLLAIGSTAFPLAYLEIIAIDPQTDRAVMRPGPRWFDMDDAHLQERVRTQGPSLIHWVARVPDAAAVAAAWADRGLERGPVLDASRMTPAGALRWRITVRPDGQRLLDGCLPTLIQWGGVHPSHDMSASGVTLAALRLQHPDADVLQQALALAGLDPGQVEVAAQSRLRAELMTPRGRVVLDSLQPGGVADEGDRP